MNGIELQDGELSPPSERVVNRTSSVADVLACYEVLHDLEQQLAEGR